MGSMKRRLAQKRGGTPLPCDVVCPVPAVLDRFTLDLDACAPNPAALRAPPPHVFPRSSVQRCLVQCMAEQRRTSQQRPNGSSSPRRRIAPTARLRVDWLDLPPSPSVGRRAAMPLDIPDQSAQTTPTEVAPRAPTDHLYWARSSSQNAAPPPKKLSAEEAAKLQANSTAGASVRIHTRTKMPLFCCAASDVSVPHSFVSLARRPGTSPETRGRRSL